MYPRLAIATLALLVSACGDSPQEPPPGEGEGVVGEWVRSDGLVRTYELHLPPSYDKNQPAPLLIAFHGSPDNGANFARRIGLDAAAHEAGFITVYPDGIGGTWIPADALFVQTLIGQLSTGLAVDTRRVYVTGYSIGGQFTHWLACALTGELAGAASVAATMGVGVKKNCSPSRSFPIVFIHGTADAVFPWEGRVLGDQGRLSVDETVGTWVDYDRCAADPTIEDLPDLTNDGTLVHTQRYTGCAAGAEVVLYIIEGGAHTWPGGPGPFPAGAVSHDIDAGVEMVEFFKQHSLDEGT